MRATPAAPGVTGTFTPVSGMRMVTAAPFCAFGNKGTTCNPLVFDDFVYTWPGNHLSVQSGSYTKHVIVRDTAATNWQWSLDVPFKIKLP